MPLSTSLMLTMLGKSSFFSSHCFPVATTINALSSGTDWPDSMIALTMSGGTGIVRRNEKLLPLTPDSGSTLLKPSLLVAAHESHF